MCFFNPNSVQDTLSSFSEVYTSVSGLNVYLGSKLRTSSTHSSLTVGQRTASEPLQHSRAESTEHRLKLTIRCF